MKKVIFISALFAFTIALTSCGEKNLPADEGPNCLGCDPAPNPYAICNTCTPYTLPPVCTNCTTYTPPVGCTDTGYTKTREDLALVCESSWPYDGFNIRFAWNVPNAPKAPNDVLLISGIAEDPYGYTNGIRTDLKANPKGWVNVVIGTYQKCNSIKYVVLRRQ